MFGRYIRINMYQPDIEILNGQYELPGVISCFTSSNCEAGNDPIFDASTASMVAILTVRMTDGDGSPACFKFETVMSFET
jgi:hypothetical protein